MVACKPGSAESAQLPLDKVKFGGKGRKKEGMPTSNMHTPLKSSVQSTEKVQGIVEAC